jgi:hypothetical protein
MNTDQRKLLRNASYLFAGIAVVAGVAAFDAGALGAAVVLAIALVIVGKFVWAGRPAADVRSLGQDLSELEGREKR